MKNYLHYCFIILIACSKKFEPPPPFSGIDIKATISIKEMRNAHIPGAFGKWAGDDIITGIVIANDASNNFYKSIVVQDSTGGITIQLDGFSLANDYPLYQRVFIRLNGLWLSEYGSMLQLGAGIDNTNPQYVDLLPIPVPLFSRYILKGNIESPPIPIHVNFDQLKDSLQSRLIQIDSVELAVADTAKPFADAINKTTVSHTLRLCGVGTVYLRTSGFADFAAIKTPRGNGSIKGIYTVFGTQKQIQIRDTGDVQMNGIRCSGARLIFYEDFESIAVNTGLQISGWKNITENGSAIFEGKWTAPNRYAEISAFATYQPVVNSWLILPPINLNNSTNEQLSFLTKDGFDNGAVLQAYISSNYDGGNSPWKAKWTPLKATIAKGSVSGPATKWTPSGAISLQGYTGKVYIAFKYEGADIADPLLKKTTRFQLDEIKIVGN
ncbi:MAG: choice-of-anchor J domain-containing protein [Chitinophagaceae bacterium]|nr:choice-of-anchor J domain-containing protein [Chitinophagaceae bacterium]